MRRKAAPPATTSEDAPAALRVGPLAEVWADDGIDLLKARSAWGHARRAWLDERGLDDAEGCRVLPVRAPWRLTDPGADARLVRTGVSRKEVLNLPRAY